MTKDELLEIARATKAGFEHAHSQVVAQVEALPGGVVKDQVFVMGYTRNNSKTALILIVVGREAVTSLDGMIQEYLQEINNDWQQLAT